MGGENDKVSIHAYSYADGNNVKYPDIEYLATVKRNVTNTGSASNVDITNLAPNNHLAFIFRIVKGESAHNESFFGIYNGKVNGESYYAESLLTKPVII